MSKKKHHNSLVVGLACTDRGAGNNQDAWGLAFHQGSTFIDAYYQAATNLFD